MKMILFFVDILFLVILKLQSQTNLLWISRSNWIEPPDERCNKTNTTSSGVDLGTLNLITGSTVILFLHYII